MLKNLKNEFNIKKFKIKEFTAKYKKTYDLEQLTILKYIKRKPVIFSVSSSTIKSGFRLSLNCDEYNFYCGFDENGVIELSHETTSKEIKFNFSTKKEEKDHKKFLKEEKEALKAFQEVRSIVQNFLRPNSIRFIRSLSNAKN